MFVLSYPTADLTGAEYNPRKITPDCEANLRESIAQIGFAKPILITKAGRIIAGHQRTNAARKLGIHHVPAFVLPDLERTIEMRLNQMHNGIDVDTTACAARVPPATTDGFEEIPVKNIDGDWRQAGATLRNEMFRMISRYGDWGCAVATQSGELLSSQQYAMATKLAGRPLRIFRVPDAKRELAVSYFGKEYGVFSYQHLERKTYLQTYAQPTRAKKTDEDATRSTLYDALKARVPKGARILDFGCGFGVLLGELQRAGYDIVGVEFFYKGDSDSLKPAVTQQMIDVVCDELRGRGLFDVVLADSVINSVDSVQAETDVLTSLSGLCRVGGELYFGGRTTEALDSSLRRTVSGDKSHRRYIEFLDGDGFSAFPLGSEWFYQKFHTVEQARALAERFIGPNFKLDYGGTWQAYGTKVVELPHADVIASLRREFDLPWPSGLSVGRADDIQAAYEVAQGITSEASHHQPGGSAGSR